MWLRHPLPVSVLTLVGLLALTACGSSGSGPSVPSPPASSTSPVSTVSTATPVPVESNPPGDIPDNLAFVPYRNPAGHYTFTHPEGWTQASQGETVTFTDKLNGVAVTPAQGPVTLASARSSVVPQLAKTQESYEFRSLQEVKVPGGTGVRIVYRRNSAPDPVTGRQYRDEIEHYEIASGATAVTMELFGPVGADNVDAYRTMVQSVRLS